MSEKLLEWTLKRWVITLTKKNGLKTFSEMRSEKKEEMLNLEKNSEVYKEFKETFSDAELVEVSKKD